MNVTGAFRLNYNAESRYSRLFKCQLTASLRRDRENWCVKVFGGMEVAAASGNGDRLLKLIGGATRR